jgi:hypothetical protein
MAEMQGSLVWEALAKLPREKQQGRLLLLHAVERHLRKRLTCR